MSDDAYAPRPEHKFSFGLWTVGNPGRDPFGEPVRPRLTPVELVALLGEVGAWGVNLHDNDLVPIDATAAERDRIVREFGQACADHGLVVPMVTTNLFTDAAFKDGAFTANDPAVRALSVQKAMGAMDLGAELGARIFVMWGGARGDRDRRLPAPRRRRPAVPRGAELPVRVLHRQRLRLPLRARGEAERAAQRHLLRDHRRLSRVHPDPRPPGAGGGEPRGRPRAHGGPEHDPRGGPGVGSGQALPHRPQRPGHRPLRPGLPVRGPRTRRRRSGS